MIDPDGIIITKDKADSEIKMGLVPECDFESYDLTDDKSYGDFIKDVERDVRSSFEYRQFIKYLRENMDMKQCAYIQEARSEPGEYSAIRIEIHHCPFSLYDICEIVCTKRQYYGESMELFMVSKEIMELHNKAVVGLIPLSETVHQLVHNGKLFIPVQDVFGRYDIFMEYYDPFISSDLKDTISRIEKYSYEQRLDLLNTTILDANNVTFNIKDQNYQLPGMNGLANQINRRIDTIKANMYQLPTVHDTIGIDDKKERAGVRDAIYFID